MQWSLGTRYKILLEINNAVITNTSRDDFFTALSKELKKLGLSHYIYNSDQKDKAIYEKYNNDNTRIWLAQIQTGIGYSIPKASYAIFYELDYSKVNYTQSKARNRRLVGGRDKFVYIHLLAENSIDQVIYDALQYKISLDNEESSLFN